MIASTSSTPNSQPSALQYYSTNSKFTDPGEYAHLFGELPTDIRELAAVVRGLLFHYGLGNMYNHVVPHERVRGDEARTVREMLAKIIALDKRPLTEPRALEQRLIGCCREYALLLAATLRHQGLPARMRWGFSPSFQPGFSSDHVMTEYWDAGANRWKLVDPQLDERHIRINNLQFDPHDVPHSRFPCAGEIWQRARAGEIDPKRYGYNEGAAGMWVIQTYLGHDLAALNKREMLIGDQWGLASTPDGINTAAEDVLLDRVADLTWRVDETWPEVLAIYEDNARLRVPPVISRFSLAKEWRGGIAVDCD